ncbi:M48 family metallopeptidase [Sandaracinobacter sp. RS1-74]|uniref:M48 family metallopeptidase n=1 Tax=Sandaracinobacteroides sayramensis TaxID=2913411 RepID=UPI001EDA986C|nr:SprT family zinc-dependent metalloprotease [Sandaracinobacteroides sayramensis]MCG2840468.1 M48 family metallopeptidase [Sandaracinobacteroides sayramensis]
MIATLRTLLGGRSPAYPLTLALPGGDLPLQVTVNPRARKLSLRLCSASRSVKLTVPPRVSRQRALAFLNANRGWVEAQATRRLPPPLPFLPGVALPLADEKLLLATGPGRVARREGDRLLVPGSGALYAGRVKRWLSAEAARRLEAETHALAARIGRDVREVRVGDFRSRWGSCAPDGRIAYSWRLILAPGHVRQSVVAHEVAHLVEPNHGPRFWKTATALLGQPHDEARAWLRANGPLLMSYGAKPLPKRQAGSE